MKAVPTCGSPRAARGRRSASKSPTMAMARERIWQPVRRPVSDWRTFATGERRPMARDIRLGPQRTNAGALALSSKFHMKAETKPDDHPDRAGRRRTLGDPRLAVE